MERWEFSDGNIADYVERRRVSPFQVKRHGLQMHSSMVQRLSLESELEGHQGCVNALAWNSKGSLLVSGSDDARINIWSYATKKLIHSIDTGHSANIFCTKFIPETSDEVVASGAGDAEVRLFNLSRSDVGSEENTPHPSATFQCHSRRVKKLAVEVGNPNVVWSASEDGTLRQHDFREGASCPSAGSSSRECHNILLDLRRASKKSLADSPRQCLALKSCDISTTRPHQLLVGGSDAFARLYDRRMLPPLSSSQTNSKPPTCINYFCPRHLSDRKKPGLHLTHVAFSPNGEELLLSYSGEHVYLMDTNHDAQDPVRYTSLDFSEQICLAPEFNEKNLLSASENVPRRRGKIGRVDIHKFVEAANKALEDGSHLYGIEACSEVLDGKGLKVVDALKHECLCTRAALLIKRKWKNDAYMAVRDCLKAKNIESRSFKAHYYMSEALSQLGKHKEALRYAIAAQEIDPSSADAADRVHCIRDHMSAVQEKNNKKIGGTSDNEEVQPGTILSLGDVFFVSGENGDRSLDGPRSERGETDSDDDDVELGFETSISGDEEHEESRVLRGSVKFHRREETKMENSSLPSCSLDEDDQKHEAAIDMKQRYIGHCNVGTDIKQASFLGQQGEFIASGSDDGRWFIWDKKTARLIKVLAGDEAVVNCVQCHPFDCVVATSGIDSTIKIWQPQAENPSIVAGGAAGPETANVLKIIGSNQQKLCHNREPVLPFELFERFRMRELAEGPLHPFECTQS